MENLQPEIRIAVRAVIIRDEQVLLLKKHSIPEGERYALPGGAQELGETLLQALTRECLEEIDCAVVPSDVIHIADFFKHRAKPQPHTRHQLEILFACSIPEAYFPRNGSHPDKNQIDVVWVALQEIDKLLISPAIFSELLSGKTTRKQGIYLGTII